MPVPSSFNDITQNSSLRDFVGWVWYDRQVWIPDSWIKSSINIKLRFGSVHYHAIVVSHSSYTDAPDHMIRYCSLVFSIWKCNMSLSIDFCWHREPTAGLLCDLL